jgi:hypothetical protein
MAFNVPTIDGGCTVIDQNQCCPSKRPGATMDVTTLTNLINDYTEPLHRYVTRLTFNDVQLARISCKRPS